VVLKPWERYDPTTYKSIPSLLIAYLVLIGKIISSNAHLVCYFFMILAVIENGGIIYMIYPALVFGIALLEEDKPGKKFWFFVVYYTCAILLLQCVAQLALWENSFQIESYTIYTDL